MFGHDWESAEATIITSRVTKTSGDGMVSIHEFVAEVRPAGAPAFRTVIGEPRISTFFWPPSPGDVVRVHVDVARQEAKFDKDDPRLDSRRRIDAVKAADRGRFDAALAAPVSPPVPAAGGDGDGDGDARDPASRLLRLQALRDAGLIDGGEFDVRRAQILAGL